MGQMTGVRQQFVKAAMSAPYLERDEEHALAVRWKEERDEQSMHKLAHAHMRLVIALAVRFRHYGLPVTDLIQEGHVGLLEAAARFDPEREVRFSTYATWWIRASMQDYILRNWSIVRGGTSSAQKSLFFNLRRLRMKMSQMPGSPTNGEIFSRIALALGVNKKDVETMDGRLSGSDVSLNAPLSSADNGPAERGDFLVDAQPLPDELTESAIDSRRRLAWLREALTALNERELTIVRERRLSDESATLEALGQKLGISKERVRQIETRAMEKLRRVMTERHPDMMQIAHQPA